MIWSSDFSWVNYFLGKAIAWKVATCRDRETPADRRGPCSYGGNFQCGSRHSAPPPPLSRPGVIPPTWLEGICDQKFALQLQSYCDPGQVSETPLYGGWKSEFSFTFGLPWTWTYITGKLNLNQFSCCCHWLINKCWSFTFSKPEAARSIFRAKVVSMRQLSQFPKNLFTTFGFGPEDPD